jgi:geranylgeranyl diphosphate/geranylgeranyl-bacteriochlorophyllide a reductase
MTVPQTFDAVVVGGGPAGATAATDLARRGRSVLLLNRAKGTKPCGAIPPKLIEEFDIPEALLVSRVTAARMVSPSARRVDMPIEGGFVGMVDRDLFDEWLRQRAAAAGAERRNGIFEHLTRDADGTAILEYRLQSARPAIERVRARAVIGADGAASAVARQTVSGAHHMRHLSAYQEIIRSPTQSQLDFDSSRCDFYYRGALSPDFYSWILPHGDETSVGTVTGQRGFALARSVLALRRENGLDDVETLRREVAPIPLRPLPRWDNGRDVVLAGDAAGVVAPASGEGLYYAMAGGRLAAQAVDLLCERGDGRVLATARKRFMKEHGQVFWILGMMQRFWYTSDCRRERFVSICRDHDVQKFSLGAYMNKELPRATLATHLRIFCRNLALDTLANEVIARPRPIDL